jgi:hypothetical protein
MDNPPIYTTCVQPPDYQDPGLPTDFFTGLGELIAYGGYGLLSRICDFLLHGRLVCLGGDRCAIGQVGGFETVDQKSGFDKLDNDFSINLVLSPVSLELFQREDENLLIDLDASDHAYDNYKIELEGPQSPLITERPGMPIPLQSEPKGKPSSRYTGTFVDFDSFGFGPAVVYPTAADKPIKVPVLHCEIEGDRTITVCSALSALWGPVEDTVCSFNPLGVPIGKLLCFILTLASLPVILPLLTAAWVAGSNDNRDFDGAGSLTKGDLIVIFGRWVYDAGHSGWNELHPVKSVQKLQEQVDFTNFADVQKRVCSRVSEAPPLGKPGSKPQGMTAQQASIYDNQTQPRNRWIYHPIIDGCQPSQPPEEIK